MYRVAKRWTFAASHQLSGLPEGHKCGRLHGHTYTVELECTGPLNAVGMVIDYGELAPFAEWLRTTFDHRHLNDVLPQPTAEAIAAKCYGWAKNYWPQAVSAARVWESADTWAEYRA